MVQMKADRRVERSPTRRGRNNRGQGHLERRKVERAKARTLPKASETLIDVAIARSARRLSRIDKMDRRFAQQLQRWVELFNKLSTQNNSVKRFASRLKEIGRPPSKGLQAMGLIVWRRMYHLRLRLLQAGSGHWGLPQELTLKRLLMVGGNGTPDWMALPRLSDEWWLSRGSMKQVTPTQIVESEPCRCRVCRVSILCPDGHGLLAGFRTCRFCPFERHPRAVMTSSTKRRGERNHPLRAPPRRT